MLISFFLRCAFPAPPWIKKLSFFTGTQPLNFLIRDFLIREPGVHYYFLLKLWYHFLVF